MADNGGQRADTWRTKCVETRPKRTQGGQIWRAQGGQGLEPRPKQTHSGYMADKLRGRSEHIAAYLFPKREPHRKLFGEKVSAFESRTGNFGLDGSLAERQTLRPSPEFGM